MLIIQNLAFSRHLSWKCLNLPTKGPLIGQKRLTNWLNGQFRLCSEIELSRGIDSMGVEIENITPDTRWQNNASWMMKVLNGNIRRVKIIFENSAKMHFVLEPCQMTMQASIIFTMPIFCILYLIKIVTMMNFVEIMILGSFSVFFGKRIYSHGMSLFWFDNVELAAIIKLWK